HHGQTIGHHDGQYPVGSGSDGGVSADRGACQGGIGIRVQNISAMYLLQPNDGSGRRGHTLAVFKHVLAVISRMQTHIERTPGGLADATNTGGAKIRHPWPIRPGDYFQPIYLLNTHYPPPPHWMASRICSKSSGQGAWNSRHCPSETSAKPKVWACSI